MDFQPSQRCSEFKERLTAFMDEHVYPSEAVYEEEMSESRRPRKPSTMLPNAPIAAASVGLKTPA